MLFRDIPPFTRSSSYMVNVGLDYLSAHYARYVVHYGLDVNPDFQRNYVWTPEQKTRFIEYFLRGGTSGLDIYVNSPTFHGGNLGPEHPESWCVLVDGKQRLDAALGFLNNEVPVFDGHYFRDFTDKPRFTQCNFRWHVNDLKTREECLQWYLDLNSGGTVHQPEELDKVRDLLAKNEPYAKPSHETILSQSRLDRPSVQEEVQLIAVEQEKYRLTAETREQSPPPIKKKGRSRGAR